MTPDDFAPKPRLRSVLQQTEPSPTVEHDQERKKTRLELIAGDTFWLTWGEMKEFAGGVLGKEATPEQIIQLADRLYGWAAANKTAGQS